MAIYESKPTKDGRKYYFRVKYKDLLGNVKDYSSKKFKLKKEAEHEERLFKINIEKQSTSSISITFSDIYDEYMLKHSKEIKPQSVIKINNQFKQLSIIHNIKINDFNLSKYNLVRRDIESKNFSVAYANKLLGLIKRLLIYSNKYHNTNDRILKFFENFKSVNEFKKEMLFFTYEEYKAFDSVINEINYKTFFTILYYMGLRQGEAQALTWNDINLIRKELSINKTLTTKLKGQKWTISTPKTKNSTRTLPMPEIVLKCLKTLKEFYKNEYADFSNDWFVFGGKFPLKETTICQKKNNYCKQADVQQIRIHDFRHSCASLLINQGASIALVSKYLGHSNISITLNTYTHFFKSELIDITKKIDNL